jgi:hypothetical protein
VRAYLSTNDEKLEGSYENSDGTPVDFLPWGRDQPDNRKAWLVTNRNDSAIFEIVFWEDELPNLKHSERKKGNLVDVIT